eukprot:CAMPEP_0116902922 /NCGR_PEP_ID=MMETSP0467-20121206/10391_1 /TAXON_ID=283647 /ORGANISM="Mesodinium pulex, Strain SPMC105" /LENGTH=163 /DNA_ID=CAMNT_0004577027 /DNA_START=691 /DNA_END=1182 /DNA_ORIENTATION=+
MEGVLVDDLVHGLSDFDADSFTLIAGFDDPLVEALVKAKLALPQDTCSALFPLGFDDWLGFLSQFDGLAVAEVVASGSVSELRLFKLFNITHVDVFDGLLDLKLDECVHPSDFIGQCLGFDKSQYEFHTLHEHQLLLFVGFKEFGRYHGVCQKVLVLEDVFHS